jgi:hypothetical protein
VKSDPDNILEKLGNMPDKVTAVRLREELGSKSRAFW